MEHLTNQSTWEAHIDESLISIEAYKNLSEQDKQEGYIGNLSFGTAGIRGKIGLGPNRLNKYTVQKVATGLAQYLIELKAEPSVVIAYDTRHFSPEFCDAIAEVLGHHNVKTYIFDRYHTTPELSFAVRHLKTDAGVMITASHNPPEYNGIKIYGPDGGQLALEASQKVSAFIDDIDDVFALNSTSKAELLAQSKIEYLDDSIINAYKSEVISLVEDIPASDLKVVFTSLHGTSVPIIPELLDALNFTQYEVVKEQAIPDGDFTSVKSANPEDHDAFDLAVNYAKASNADLLIATDPDADRMGIVAHVDGKFHYFNGNQIGALLLHYRIQSTKTIENRAAVKSIVTSDLGRKIAEANNVKMFDVLTGFKFIAEKIAQFESSLAYNYIFGYEESYGYMAGPFVRDKDAVQIVPLIIKLASELKNEQRTIVDQMNDIYSKYGHYQEKLFSHTFEGQEGKAHIEKIMHDNRAHFPSEIAGQKVIRVDDYLAQTSYADGSESKIDLPKADVLKFHFENGWIALRPSGTEPKIKLYISMITDDIASLAEEMNQAFFN
ncbi:phospho-sugar mutase [Macrococcoides caseolyticum]|uniref:phospho-sugar mutase n=1 Tax=Macrococcoides caseolyticum TaxID=69966 RepID=UPI000C33355B|nr:phospho-sugar mutase [Macrococcus caseolyticus]PKE21336.1 phospho-sugar mutase [Macrococcus caseolyticus]PKE35464.1 phospho-sugar mutase [Macrococcus caseolyticus]PKE71913.1 phospho-sugar mutase [Macrococcus caseolyticus]PKE74065.1 phospho-sugar mutase [Macrococcus caseolyticus]PKF06351.1 phospho-sugar mutase [Macrococcus caseolyticus]